MIKVKKNFIPIVTILLLVTNHTVSQTYSKQGGLFFRVDDNQPIVKWKEYADLFDKYGFKFSFALNLAIVPDAVNYFDMIRDFQKRGHEFMDHTPNHYTVFFTDPNSFQYKNHIGVDHISGEKVCLKYREIDTAAQYHGGGFANIQGDTVFSQTNGGFKLFGLQTIYSRIFFPTLNLLCAFSVVKADDDSDIDTLIIKSNWYENIKIPKTNNVPYKIVSSYDIILPDESVALLAERTLTLCKENNIQRPFSWIQPGGLFVYLPVQQIKKIYGDNYGYTSASDVELTALKVFNEYDPQDVKRFAMKWSDFNEDFNSFFSFKKLIADQIAKHRVLAGHSHFGNLLGGWDGYIKRMDSILSWCKDKNIAIRTQNVWANILYTTTPNPYENIFPPLSVDLNEDGNPDGYYDKIGYTNGILDTTDSPSTELRNSYSISKSGSICYISGLAGLEKGEDDFYISTKGSPGDSVEVVFSFPEKNGSSTKFKYPASSLDWITYGTEHSTTSAKTLTIPFDVSYCDVRVSCSNYASGIVKVGGFVLRKKITEPIKIISLPVTTVKTDTDYEYYVQTVAKFKEDTLQFAFDEAPAWLSVDQQGKISGKSGSKIGSYSVTVRVTDQHENTDTQSYVLRVRGTSKLYSSIRRMNFGTLVSKQKIDTVLIIKNEGNDTLEISSFYRSDSTISCEYSAIVPPDTEEQIKISLIPGNKDSISTFFVLYSNSPTSPDTFFFVVKFNSISQLGGKGTIPSEFSVSQNYPNPFNSGTVLNYALKSQSKISMVIYNMLGQVVKVIKLNNVESAGYYQFHWNGDGDNGLILSSGVYFCRTMILPVDGSPQKEFTNKMLLLR